MADTKNAQLVQKQEIAKAIGNQTIADSIINSMAKLAGQGAVSFPKGYNYGNNLKLAYLQLSQSGSLAKVTTASVGEALVEMVVQGLDIAKKQCYFIPYGNKLTMIRSYFGDVSALENTGLVVVGSTKAVVVYEGDEIEVAIENDEEVLKSFKADPNVFARHNKKIIGAYAVTTLINNEKKYVFMSKEEIDKSWAKSKDPTRNVQKDFAQEMAKRTVLRRLTKYIGNFSNSLDSLTEQQTNTLYSYIRTTEEQYDDNKNNNNSSNQRSTINIPTIETDEGIDSDEVIDLTQDTEKEIEVEPVAEETKQEDKIETDKGEDTQLSFDDLSE